jgi:fatty acid desaturase
MTLTSNAPVLGSPGGIAVAPIPPAPETSPAERGSDFARLSQRIASAGLMRKRNSYYVRATTLVVGALVTGWVGFALLGDSWWQLIVAAWLAVAFTQVSFLGHDGGHRQVFRTRRASEIVGMLLGNVGVGLSYGWWVDKHTRHHANPNHEDEDPDVGAGVLLWSEGQARERRGWTSRLAGFQAFFFFPLLLLEGLNLHVASLRAVFGRGTPIRHRKAEAFLLAAHVIGYLSVVFLVLSPGKALAFIAVHQGLWGLYMGCSFAPNHKGMPMVTDEDSLDFLRKQVLTSRNVRGGRFTDVLLGGLNYQIEHHLFPSMPRPHLRLAQPIVEGYCREQGIAYEQTGLARSYRMALAYLHEVAAPLRRQRA